MGSTFSKQNPIPNKLLSIIFLLAIAKLYLKSKKHNLFGRSEVIHIDDHEIRYTVSGRGKPIILYPSAGRPHSDFNELAKYLNEDGYQTIAISSERTKSLDGSELTLFDFAYDILCVLEAEKVKRQVILLGHASGNMIVRAFASRYQNLVSRVILLAAESGEIPIDEQVDRYFNLCFNSYLPWIIRKTYVQHTFFAENETIPDHWQHNWDATAAKNIDMAKKNTDPMKYTRAGEAPMLVIQGLEDTVAPPKHGRRLITSVPPGRAALVELENAGHALLSSSKQIQIIYEHIHVFLQSPRFQRTW